MILFEHETGGKIMKQIIKKIVSYIIISSKVKNSKVASVHGMYQPNLKDLQD